MKGMGINNRSVKKDVGIESSVEESERVVETA